MTALRRAYRLLAFSFAGLLLITSINCAIDMHFCGGKLVSVSLFGRAKSCTDATAGQKGCRRSEDHQLAGTDDLHRISRQSCCRDQLLHIQLDQDQKQERVERNHNPPVDLPLIAKTPLSVRSPIHQQLSPIRVTHEPPDPRRDLRLFIQSFLL